ncbi:hypothetical protein JGH11_17560 [Dysgonomonas sp. Marseille-P4677]|uniref:hypothetical protein n=1 Tax=Dysgonomonas sp. Marseille-P4677 TaxID=2364790 RepID=UPI0019117827|nr:hypothetical protein [Dysgonomonas sp. Marseille-P4677]MBK5722686.1 hypothetical protein [Dysgonomonas sp. Marseille-P4677]
MKNKFKYQWNSFFDYLGAFDSSFNGKLRFFYQRIQNDPKNKDERYFNHIWTDEKERTKKRISRYSKLVNLRTISLPLIIVAIAMATICFFLKSWLIFYISSISVLFLLPYWVISRDFLLDKDSCLNYLQWMHKSEVQGKIPEIIDNAFESDVQIVSTVSADLTELTQSELTALLTALILSNNLKLSVTDKEFIRQITSQITISGKSINFTSFYKSYSRFKNDPFLAKSAYDDLLDRLKNIDLDKI